MMVKTAELTDLGLRWAVSQAVGQKVRRVECAGNAMLCRVNGKGTTCGHWQPDVDPAQAWPIIDQTGITLRPHRRGRTIFEWAAWLETGRDLEHRMFGPTSLIAAMRCKVASVLGPEVDVPDELVREDQARIEDRNAAAGRQRPRERG